MQAVDELDGARFGKALADTLSMLAEMVNVVPDATWVPSLCETVGRLDPSAPGCSRMRGFLDEHEDCSLDELVRLLAVDWTLAFRGVNPASGPRPPYAGAWLSDDGTGVDLMLAVNTVYVEEGLGSGGGHLNRFDYLGVEIEFLAYLAEKLDDPQCESELVAAKIVDFEERFILSWLARYRSQVEEKCQTEFWKGFLELLEAVLRDLADELRG